MSTRTLTHIIGATGRCQHCGTALLAYLPEAVSQNVYPGHAVGLVESQHGGTRAYKAGEHDSNERCAKPKEAK